MSKLTNIQGGRMPQHLTPVLIIAIFMILLVILILWLSGVIFSKKDKDEDKTNN